MWKEPEVWFLFYGKADNDDDDYDSVVDDDDDDDDWR